MRFAVTFKSPDALAGLRNQCFIEATRQWEEMDDEVRFQLTDDGIDKDEWVEERRDELLEKTTESIKSFVKYGELVRAEFDTETNQARLLPANSW